MTAVVLGPGQADIAGAASATLNGDVNGDGNINLSDVVYLLNFLFQGGEPIVPIDCGEPDPEPGAPQFRLLNDLSCNGGTTAVRLELCATTITRLTNEAFDVCRSLDSGDSCQLRVSVDAVCGSIEYCTEIDPSEGASHDFVFTLWNGAPALLLFVQPLAVDGSCAAFPTPGSPPTRIIAEPCAGLGAGGGLVSGDWATTGTW